MALISAYSKDKKSPRFLFNLSPAEEERLNKLIALETQELSHERRFELILQAIKEVSNDTSAQATEYTNLDNFLIN